MFGADLGFIRATDEEGKRWETLSLLMISASGVLLTVLLLNSSPLYGYTTICFIHPDFDGHLNIFNLGIFKINML